LLPNWEKKGLALPPDEEERPGRNERED